MDLETRDMLWVMGETEAMSALCDIYGMTYEEALQYWRGVVAENTYGNYGV